MNIFYLHQLPQIAASYHCDKHVGKMLIETCQMLATAHHQHGNGDKVTYKQTHVNHPSNVWVRESRLHYDWAAALARELGREFFKRYGKHHKSYDVLMAELWKAPPAMFKLPLKWRTPPLAMPVEHHCDDAIKAYRQYYASKTRSMEMVWNRHASTPPDWFVDILFTMEEATA
jgi:hypothetical protein